MPREPRGKLGLLLQGVLAHCSEEPVPGLRPEPGWLVGELREHMAHKSRWGAAAWTLGFFYPSALGPTGRPREKPGRGDGEVVHSLPPHPPQLTAEERKKRAGEEWEIWKASGSWSQGFSFGNAGRFWNLGLQTCQLLCNHWLWPQLFLQGPEIDAQGQGTCKEEMSWESFGRGKEGNPDF